MKVYADINSLDRTEGERRKEISCRAAATEGRARCVCCRQQETPAGDQECLTVGTGCGPVVADVRSVVYIFYLYDYENDQNLPFVLRSFGNTSEFCRLLTDSSTNC